MRIMLAKFPTSILAVAGPDENYKITLGGGKIAKPGRVHFHLKKVISSWIGTPMEA